MKGEDDVVVGRIAVAGVDSGPKMGLNVLLGATGGAKEGTDCAVAETTMVLLGEKLKFSLFAGLPNTGLKIGTVPGAEEDGVVAAEGLSTGGLVRIPKRMLGFGADEGLDGVWPDSEEAVTKLPVLLVGREVPEEGEAMDRGTGTLSARGLGASGDVIGTEELKSSEAEKAGI